MPEGLYSKLRGRGFSDDDAVRLMETARYKPRNTYYPKGRSMGGAASSFRDITSQAFPEPAIELTPQPGGLGSGGFHLRQQLTGGLPAAMPNASGGTMLQGIADRFDPVHTPIAPQRETEEYIPDFPRATEAPVEPALGAGGAFLRTALGAQAQPQAQLPPVQPPQNIGRASNLADAISAAFIKKRNPEMSIQGAQRAVQNDTTGQYGALHARPGVVGPGSTGYGRFNPNSYENIQSAAQRGDRDAIRKLQFASQPENAEFAKQLWGFSPSERIAQDREDALRREDHARQDEIMQYNRGLTERKMNLDEEKMRHKMGLDAREIQLKEALGQATTAQQQQMILIELGKLGIERKKLETDPDRMLAGMLQGGGQTPVAGAQGDILQAFLKNKLPGYQTPQEKAREGFNKQIQFNQRMNEEYKAMLAQNIPAEEAQDMLLKKYNRYAEGSGGQVKAMGATDFDEVYKPDPTKNMNQLAIAIQQKLPGGMDDVRRVLEESVTNTRSMWDFDSTNKPQAAKEALDKLMLKGIPMDQAKAALRAIWDESRFENSWGIGKNPIPPILN